MGPASLVVEAAGFLRGRPRGRRPIVATGTETAGVLGVIGGRAGRNARFAPAPSRRGNHNRRLKRDNYREHDLDIDLVNLGFSD